MYGKLFEQMYDGTLGTKGPWQALVTFQQMIILADADGIVDMTAEVISRRSTIPFEIISEGIRCLEAPDPNSRTPDEEGRRIVLLDPARNWGWRIVNYGHYRKIRSEEERREYMRNYQRQRRASKQVNSSLTSVNNVTQAVSSKQYEEEPKDTVGQERPTPPPAAEKRPNGKTYRLEAQEILQFLNVKAGRGFPPLDVNLDLIAARLKEGATPAQCRQVIAKKAREWGGNPDMAEYLRPKTLFNRTNFAQYVGELVVTQ